ncbi:MAG TPA: hypothetical protein VI160_06455 [Gemmatimonadales bacterium]
MLVGAAACGNIAGDLRGVIAIDVVIPDSARVETGDTIIPTAVALDGAGDTVTGAAVFWSSLDTAGAGILQLVDSAAGTFVALAPGTSQIQARVGNLRSNPIAVTVLLRADTLFADSTPARDSVSVAAKPDSLSDSLRIRIRTFADTVAGGNLPGRRVVFQLLYPSDTTSFTLVPNDTVTTDAAGLAVVQVKLKNRPLPDSAVVQATATRVNGRTVHGAPVTFTVVFSP